MAQCHTPNQVCIYDLIYKYNIIFPESIALEGVTTGSRRERRVAVERSRDLSQREHTPIHVRDGPRDRLDTVVVRPV